MRKIDLKNTKHIKTKVDELLAGGSIKQDDEKVAKLISLMVKKANNNLKFAKTTLALCENNEVKDSLGLQEKDSFYDWVIVVAYYAMFHITQALLATKKIKITNIRVHEATLYAFAHNFILTKELEDELFFTYEDAEAKAEELFTSLSEERRKRGKFTYERLPQANKEPAEESITHATEFVREIETILKRQKFL